MKKLSVAFVWHMHQPVYKNLETNEYLMPWVRLHAVKDYLDMFLVLEKFPKLRQTFNLVPSLLEQIEDYTSENVHDRHSRLTVSNIEFLSDEDRSFILDRFFDANYPALIYPHQTYRNLYEKRYKSENICINDFSDQEYSDLMMWFNLCWFDNHWIESLSDLKYLYEKKTGYTLEDRKLVISIQRAIIAQIIPKIKSMYDKGQIEISTSPYYHPLMPLVINSESAKNSVQDVNLPERLLNFEEDIIKQLDKSFNKIKTLFGCTPSGIWPPEHCISTETVELLSKYGIKWTLSDEGVLSKTIGIDFVRDFAGDLLEPYHLSSVYQFNQNGSKMYSLFRDSVLCDLIAFEYGIHNPEVAANDLYERIKNIQTKLQLTPDKAHVLTIALDGENCWENYKQDNRSFLSCLYSLLSADESLNVQTVSDIIQSQERVKTLKTIHSGSWINRNYCLWTGEPTKNQAWNYIYETRKNLVNLSKEKKHSPETLEQAWNSLYTAEGSDWFWWYGEPNDSGQDELFDQLFRMHLINVYKSLGEKVPDYLNIPLEFYIEKSSKTPDGKISPVINGMIDSATEWDNAGSIEIPQGPMYQYDRVVRRILFGNDDKNIYFRFYLNKLSPVELSNEIYVYFYLPDSSKYLSPMRLRTNKPIFFSAQKSNFSYELEIPLYQGCLGVAVLSESIECSLWKVKLYSIIESAYKSVLEVAVSFGDI